MSDFRMLAVVGVWLLSIFNIMLTVSVFRRLSAFIEMSTNKAPSNPIIGKPAPYFEASTLNGQKVSLIDFANNQTALVVISPTCMPCIEQLPNLRELRPYAYRSGTDIRLISIGDMPTTLKVAQEHGVEEMILLAEQDREAFSKQYRLQGTPSYYLINAEGNVEKAGFLDNEWEALVRYWRTDKASLAV